MRIRFCHPGLALLLIMMISCTKEPPPKEPEQRISPVAFQHESSVWVEDQISTMSLEEKIGQLFILKVPPKLDQNTRENLKTVIERYHPGGFILTSHDDQEILLQANFLQSCSKIPLWITHEHGILPQDPGGLQTMGAIRKDSIFSSLTQNRVSYYQGLGINLDFSLPYFHASKVSGNSPVMTADRSKNLSRTEICRKTMETAGILPAIIPVPDESMVTIDSLHHAGSFQGNKNDLLANDYAMIPGMIRTGLPAIMLENVVYPALDPEHEFACLSKTIGNTYLRKGLNYDGLVFTGDLSAEAIQWRYKEEPIALKALTAGADHVVNPSDFVSEYSNVLQSQKKSSGEWISHKVRNILRAKAWIGLECYVPANEKNVRSRFFTRQLAGNERLIATQSITICKNTQRALPLGNLKRKKVACLSIGTERTSAFQRRMRNYDPVTSYVELSPDSAKLSKRLSALGRFDYVIVGLHDLPYEHDNQLSSFLQKLSAKTKLLTFNFGSADWLDQLHELPCVVQAYQNTDGTQLIAADLAFGAERTNGSLPFAAGTFPAGTGLKVRSPWRLRNALPEETGVTSNAIAQIDTIANYAIRLGTFPGCQVLVAKNSKIIHNRAYGYHTYDRIRKVEKSDLYDLASLTKVIATTISVMHAYEHDSIKLEGKLKDYIPECDTNVSRIKNIVLEDILIHKAGLSAGLPIYNYMTYVDSTDSLKSILYSTRKDSLHTLQIAEDFYFSKDYRDTLFQKIIEMKLVNKGYYTYSDLGFFLLKEVIEHVFEESLAKYAYRRFYHPLGMKRTTFRPLRQFEDDEIIPTERDGFWRKQLIHGHVHDPAAAMLGGVSGHAGLFSNASDLAVLMQMLLNRGTYGGEKYLDPKTVELFTQRHPDSHRGMGWDKPAFSSDKIGLCISSASPATFGHTGFTGTCIWVDPVHDLVYIFLSNRVHPKSKNQRINGFKVRQSIQQVVYDAYGIKGTETGETRPDVDFFFPNRVALSDSSTNS